MKFNVKISSIAVLFAAFSCQQNATQSQSPVSEESIGELTLVEAFPNLDFERPVDLQGAADGTNRVFVIEQEGIISVFENNETVSEKTVFLDISDGVDDNHNEEGLLGLAFHPNYESNGYFYVNYTVASSETFISRFKVSDADPNVADPNSELVLLRYDQPFGNHDGGQVAFGADGYLYIAVGDGGSGGDPHENGQNLTTILGTILRIDVDNTADGNNYAIPADNPFVANATAKKEIYAYGLRNPWRMAFDPATNKLWCADVGQNKFEEVDIIESGKNYGWNIREGFHAFEDNTADHSDMVEPIWEIAQSTGDHSITGGYVYRGATATSLTGKYIYGDYVSGRIYALEQDENMKASNTTLMDTRLAVASFGTDDNQELYVCAFDGKIYRFQD